MFCTGIRRLVTWQWFDAVISKLLLGDVAAICYTLFIIILCSYCNFVLFQNTGVIVVINIICAIVFAAQVGADGQ